MFLPPNITSLIQPLDQGIIEKFKRCYRNDLMEKISLDESHKESEDNDFLKLFNLLDACNLCALAEITEIPSINIIGNEPFYTLMKRIQEFKMCSAEEVESWLRSNIDDNGWQRLSDEDILAGRDQAEPKMIAKLDDEISYSDQNWTIYDSVVDGDCLS
ncbi:hypothetical protein KQX54_013950 [Cotesia glomerata]|uniref:DDE-1 domain-containing protein n=1 Tax=Cotesia glomerata TaxID=32391 RepID=A0AAV7HZY8_COTGL|nr:hypothetical protein KQX54_013950 [Cotesia glomerata]